VELPLKKKRTATAKSAIYALDGSLLAADVLRSIYPEVVQSVDLEALAGEPTEHE
jgi:hypothetical protein